MMNNMVRRINKCTLIALFLFTISSLFVIKNEAYAGTEQNCGTYTCGTCPAADRWTCGFDALQCCCTNGCNCVCDNNQCATSSGWDSACPGSQCCSGGVCPRP